MTGEERRRRVGEIRWLSWVMALLPYLQHLGLTGGAQSEESKTGSPREKKGEGSQKMPPGTEKGGGLDVVCELSLHLHSY